MVKEEIWEIEELGFVRLKRREVGSERRFGGLKSWVL